MTERPGGMREQIHERLSARFAPESLDVIDDSESHRGHSGWREGGETHFKVVMRCQEFNDMSRVARSRAVHAALREELADQIHALALDLDGVDS